MHVDIDGATRIARAASEFDWTWYTDDIDRFCAVMGWELTRRGENGGDIRTDLPINRPELHASWRKRSVNYLSVWVSDIAGVADQDQRRILVEGFSDVRAALVEILGQPTEILPGDEPEIRWDFPKVVLFISLDLRTIALEIVSPEHQAWKDEMREYEE